MLDAGLVAHVHPGRHLVQTFLEICTRKIAGRCFSDTKIDSLLDSRLRTSLHDATWFKHSAAPDEICTGKLNGRSFSTTEIDSLLDSRLVAHNHPLRRLV